MTNDKISMTNELQPRENELAQPRNANARALERSGYSLCYLVQNGAYSGSSPVTVRASSRA